MKLAPLLSIYPQLKWGDHPTAEVVSICRDSRLVKEGSLYVAIRGHQVDGHDFLPQACSKGAVGVIVESTQNLPKDFRGAIVEVPDARKALETVASRFYHNPAQLLYCVGVTGTNGKTSTTYLIEAILNRFGWSTGVMGTINHHLGPHVWESQMTTPDPIDLQKRLAEFVSVGARAAAFEVSSHALSQSRVDGIPFDGAVFTNLTRDHLDYHGDMENYFLAKQRLFYELLSHSTKSPTHAIVNKDCAYGCRLKVSERAVYWTYGMREADFSFSEWRSDFSGSWFRLSHPRGVTEVELPLIGRHNIYNAVAAFAVGIAAGAGADTCAEALAEITGIPGRMERVSGTRSGIHVFVDYAHTDDALQKALISLNEIRQQAGLASRIITVFGCGGDRDTGKRPLMGQVAEKYSDLVIVTSDNPRSESPEKIIADIVDGIPQSLGKGRVFTLVDRREAIRRAIELANTGDVVLIAGKGHEKYQLIKEERLAFSDVEVAAEFL